MKRFVSLLCFLFCFIFCLNAQDLIVTTEKDSLNCKITHRDRNYIYFLYLGGEYTRDSLLPREQVVFHRINYFNWLEVDPSIAIRTVVSPWNQSYYFFVDGGWGYRTGKAVKTNSPGMDNYLEKLRNGFCIKAGGHYYWNEHLGIGLDYSFFDASTVGENIRLPETDAKIIEDDIFLHYVGVTFNMRVFFFKNRNALILSPGAGYLRYKDKNRIGINVLNKTGNAGALSIAVGYDVFLSRNVALGIKLAAISGSLDKLKLSSGAYRETQKLGKKENLTHISLTMGLRFIGKRF